MGAKHASVHLRCDDSQTVLTKLKKEFDEKKEGSNSQNMLALEFIRAFAGKKAGKTTPPDDGAGKEAAMANFVKYANTIMTDDVPATIVVREYFISIYWYDHIRSDNLQNKMSEYSIISGAPAIGTAVYDDTNFQIYAVRDAGTPNERTYCGEYMFDYQDVRPVNAEDVCNTVNAPFLLDGLRKTLSCNDGETMADTFEYETGLPIYMDDALCEEYGMKRLHEWENATVFLALPAR